MTRIIHYGNENGSIEGVHFTEDKSLDVKTILPKGCKVENDITLDEDMPSTFPMDYYLEKQN